MKFMKNYRLINWLSDMIDALILQCSDAAVQATVHDNRVC